MEMIEHRLAWRDSEHNEFILTPAWRNMYVHYLKLRGNDYNTIEHVTKELAQFNASLGYNTVTGEDVKAIFEAQEDLAHFILVWG